MPPNIRAVPRGDKCVTRAFGGATDCPKAVLGSGTALGRSEQFLEVLRAKQRLSKSVDGMAACPKAAACCSTASSTTPKKARNRVQPDAGPAGNRRAHTKMKQDASSTSSATFIAASASIAAMRKKARWSWRKYKIKEEVRRLRNSGGDTIPKKVAVSNYVLLQAQLIDVPNAKCCSSRPILPEMLPHPIVYGSACSGLGTEYWSARAAHPARPFVIAFTCDNSDESK